MKRPKVVALIPLRGGSKSINLKNIKEINGKPLYYWVLHEAVKCRLIEKIYVSTDSEEIRTSVLRYCNEKIALINRTPESATDSAPTELVMLQFAKMVDFDYIVLIQATSPLLEEKYLTEGIQKILNGQGDSAISFVRQKRFIWREEGKGLVPVNYNPLCRPRRQDFPGFYVENGAFYITSREALLQTKCRISGKIVGVEMPEESYFELDEPSDWIIVEQLLKAKLEKNKNLTDRLKRIKAIFFDCDGVLTDGGMYYSETGDELKKFNTRDGMAVELLKKKGIITAIITGENVELVKKRGQKIKVNEIVVGSQNKINDVLEICNKYNIDLSEVAYIGDDLNDLEVIKSVGLSFAVQDAIGIVKENADFVLKAKGGEGALREVADMLLS